MLWFLVLWDVEHAVTCSLLQCSVFLKHFTQNPNKMFLFWSPCIRKTNCSDWQHGWYSLYWLTVSAGWGCVWHSLLQLSILHYIASSSLFCACRLLGITISGQCSVCLNAASINYYHLCPHIILIKRGKSFCSVSSWEQVPMSKDATWWEVSDFFWSKQSCIERDQKSVDATNSALTHILL